MTVIDTGSLDDDVLDEEGATEHIHGICLKTGPPRRVGVELEWLVRDARDPGLPVPAGRIAAAVSAFDAVRSGGAHRGTRGHRDSAQHGEHAGGRDGAELPSSSRPGVLPSGAPLTTEPGGQLELSSLPADSLTGLVRATSADLAALRAALARDGLELAGIGLDPLRPPRRILHLPRYAAMEAFFDRDGPWGRQMMCSTASVQVCLDAGDDSDGPAGYRWRWRLLHAVGPVLVAAFANSPLRDGKPTGWASSRQQVWAQMDPGRTQPPGLDGEPRAAWARYALDADLMCVCDPDSADWSAPPGLTLRDWLRAGAARSGGGQAGDGRPCPQRSGTAGGAAAAGEGAARTGAGGAADPGQEVTDAGPLRRPGVSDLNYHLSTLFPPVRPRGHFELRMIDAQPGDGWVVPLAVSWALLSDERAGDAALAAVAPLWNGRPPGLPDRTGADAAVTRRTGIPGRTGPGRDGRDEDGPWLRAARLGPADPLIATASRECFAAAREALDRMRVPGDIAAAVDAFREAYVSNDRCPADDLLEEEAA